jgi:hypothetical protein
MSEWYILGHLEIMEYRINWVNYIPYASAAGMMLHINGNSQWENWNDVLCCKVSFLISPHIQFLGVGQDMKQT